MRTLFLTAGWAWAGLVVATHSVQAQQSPSVWTVRGYDCPGDLLDDGFVSDTKGRIQPPPGPGQNPTDEALREFIRRSSAVLREYLKQHAIELPEGTLLVLDKERHRLAARTTEEGHEVLADFAKFIENLLPRMLAMQVQVIEADAPVLRQAMSEALGRADDSALLTRLEEQAAGGGAKVVGLASLKTKSGQRARVSAGSERQTGSEFEARADGSSAAGVKELELEALEVEMDPVLGADGRTIDVTLAVKQPTAPASERMVPLGRIGDKRARVRVADRFQGQTHTSTTLISGQSRLLAVWPAVDAARSQAAFLTAHAVPLKYRPDERAEQWLRQHGEAVQPAPVAAASADQDLGIPAGMILKRFRVTPDFLEKDQMPPPPADPFSAAPAGGAMRNPEPTLMVRMTVQEVLKAEGIPFPEGASASYLPNRGELIVRNTPENMAKVEAFLAERRRWTPRNMHLRLSVIEADSALVRRLNRAALAVTDHEEAWQALAAEVEAGRAAFVASAMMESKSGQRATVEATQGYLMVDANLSAQVRSAGKDTEKNAAVAALSVAEIQASTEMRPVGLRWEVDPVLGGDGMTMDITTGVTLDARPPREFFDPPAEQEGTLTVDMPAVEFFPQHFSTSWTTYSGMKRWIGTWVKLDDNGQPDPSRLRTVFIEAAVCAVE